MFDPSSEQKECVDDWRPLTSASSAANPRASEQRTPHPVFLSVGNKTPRPVSIHAESIGGTVFRGSIPFWWGSGRDAEPCQRQLLSPFVRAKSKHQGSPVGQTDTQSWRCFRGCSCWLMLLLTLCKQSHNPDRRMRFTDGTACEGAGQQVRGWTPRQLERVTLFVITTEFLVRLAQECLCCLDIRQTTFEV